MTKGEAEKMKREKTKGEFPVGNAPQPGISPSIRG
jgi:hypothetical protein